jgi:hypothetical protein
MNDRGNLRTYRVDLDAAQYEMDQTEVLENKADDMYATFNLVMRRKPKENNFKAVLTTIRDLMATKCSVPSWLHDVFLGYGDAASAQYWNLATTLKDINFNDTFLDLQHLKDSFLEPIEVTGKLPSAQEVAVLGHSPFTITFPNQPRAPDFAALQTLLLHASTPGADLPHTAAASSSSSSSPPPTPSFSLTITPPPASSSSSSSSLSSGDAPSSPMSPPHSPLPTFTRPQPTFELPDFALAAPTPPPAATSSSSSSSSSKVEPFKPSLSDDEVKKMKVKDLTSALEERGITVKKALKADLEAKLRAELDKERVAYDAKVKSSSSDDAKFAEAERAFKEEKLLFERKRAEYESEKSVYQRALTDWEKAKAEHDEIIRKKKEQREADRTRRAAEAAKKSAEKAKAAAATTTASTTPAIAAVAPVVVVTPPVEEKKRAPLPATTAAKSMNGSSSSSSSSSVDLPLQVRTDRRPLPWGHYPKRNRVRFTPIQVEAIKSGLNHGLTMVVGPPGTGKTDVAVQIMSELYHNFPGQRTLLVTHSNHALNDLFEKIMQRDIPERYLLRLGHGAEGLESDRDFSKFGRVQDMLYRRASLLEEVKQLALSMGMSDDVAYTCETAGHFWKYHIEKGYEKFGLGVARAEADWKRGIRRPKPKLAVVPIAAPVAPRTKLVKKKKSRASKAKDDIEEFDEDDEEENKTMDETDDAKTEAVVPVATPTPVPAAPVVEETGPEADARDRARVISETFPFKAYFERHGHQVFGGVNIVDDMNAATDLYRHLTNIFTELEECRPFELLRTYHDRGNYLVTKHAKVIAMTCTHAAIRRGELVKNAFQYDNLIMEEAAQILEIETFIPYVITLDFRLTFAILTHCAVVVIQ